MTAAPTPPRPRPTWREPRFLLGLVLVVASMSGVAALLVASDRTVEVYAARHALAAGDAVTADDLGVVRVRLGDATASYLHSAPRPGTVVTRSLSAGELVPLGALGSASARKLTSVMITTSGELPGAVAAGGAVDVWAAAANGAGGGGPKFAAPRQLVAGATVVRVVRETGLGASGGTSVELRVPKDSAAPLLQAIADSDAMSLLPAGA